MFGNTWNEIKNQGEKKEECHDDFISLGGDKR